MAEKEVDSINFKFDKQALDLIINTLIEIENRLSSINQTEVFIKRTDADEVLNRLEEVEEKTEEISDGIIEKNEEVKRSYADIGNTITKSFKKATLAILGTAAAIGINAQRLNRVTAGAIGAGIDVREAQVGGAIFESAGASREGYVEALQSLRDIKAEIDRGRPPSEEFLRRSQILGVGIQDIISSTPEELADAYIRAAERAAAESPEQLDSIRTDVQTVLGEEFAQVFDYNQQLRRSWDDLKEEFGKYAKASNEAAKANAEFTKEMIKTKLFFDSLLTNIQGIFSDNFKEPLERVNKALAFFHDDLDRLAKIFSIIPDLYESSVNATTDIIEDVVNASDPNQTPDVLSFLPPLMIARVFRFFNDSSPEEVPNRSLSDMERTSQSIQNNVENNQAGGNTQNNNSNASAVTVNGPLIQVNGNATSQDAANIANQSRRALEQLAIPRVSNQRVVSEN